QASQRAIINWNTFNIAAGSEVRFNQPNAGASVLNRIFDLNPSIIQGKLSANGQVYLLNQNGILFDRGSQVNVHTLLASTLHIDDAVYKNSGLVAGQFAAALSAVPGSAPQGVVLRGTIETPAGGAVYVFAPEVRNDGLITSPDGQVILAAGHTVYLYENPDPGDFSMRGLFVEVRAEDRPVDLTRLLEGKAAATNLVTNAGQIRAPRGNVTLAGLAINQDNLVSASSAALQNGSVWLLAKTRDQAGQTVKTGVVTLGAGSVTETPLDKSDATTLSEDQDYTKFRSLVQVEGRYIDHRGRISSPGGVVTLNARDAENPASSNTSRIHLAAGSVVDAAGAWVDLPLSKAFLNIKITSNELKDAPLQKGGLLLGQTLTVDIREGTPLFDISGYVGAIKRSVAEKAAVGGEIRIASQNGDLILREGATLDVSGGGYRYGAGFNETSRLVSNGRSYDVSVASPNLLYEGLGNVALVSHEKWGVTERFVLYPGLRGSYESASVEGKSAGSVTIDAIGGAVIDGLVAGSVVAGRRQIASGKLPQGALFAAGSESALAGDRNLRLREVNFTTGPSLGPGFAPAVTSGDGSITLTALPDALAGDLSLPVSFFRQGRAVADGGYEFQGFGNVSLAANERIALGEGLRIDMPAGGNLTLVSSRIDVAGTISAPGGTIDLRAVQTATSDASAFSTLHVADSGRLSVGGLWINESLASLAGAERKTLPYAVNGGRINLVSQSLLLDKGSLVDASGGGRMSSAGSLTNGNGGTIRLRAGDSLGESPGYLTRLDGRLQAFGLNRGGTLDLQTGRVRIGGSAGADPAELWLSTEFLTQGGFHQYTIAGLSTLTVAGGSEIRPRAQTLRVDRSRSLTQASGSSVFDFSAPTVLPDFQRSPAGISLSSLGASAGVLTVEEGAAITLDPFARLSLTASNIMDIRGRLDAPGGEIRLSLAGGTNDGLPPGGMLKLAATSALLSRGGVLLQPDALGRDIGEVHGGGVVSINTFKRNLVMEAGSLIDVSGAQALLEIPRQQIAGRVTAASILAKSNAGSVLISATETASLDGTMRGQAAEGAAGGSFALDFVRHRDPQIAGELRHRIVVTQSADTSSDGAGGVAEIVMRLDRLASGGFDNLRLRAEDAIEFHGDVSLQLARGLRLDAPE
ncbi:MAG: filamentous hemagglutinin N-terminal domain-containing protein, partial [Burkholderiales bacterium]